MDTSVHKKFSEETKNLVGINERFDNEPQEVQEYNKTIDNFLSKADSGMTEEDYKLLFKIKLFRKTN